MTKIVQLLFFTLFTTTTICSENVPTSEISNNPIIISSDTMNYETETITVREDRKVLIRCVHERNDLRDKSDLTWKKSGGHIISGETAPSSLFSVASTERSTNYNKNSLHFTAVHTRDSGFYICSAKTTGGDTFEKTIKLTVLPKVRWINAETTVGALVGEPLTIDCRAVSGSSKDIKINLATNTGEILDDSIFKQAGDEATIESLQKEHSGLVVSCIAIEFYKEENEDEFPLVDRKDVKIEVYHAPEFATEETVKNTVIDDHVRDVTLECIVSASNPKVKHFTFYHNDREIGLDDSRYSVKHHHNSHKAYLNIREVNEQDLGTYRCEANNGQAKGHHNIHLNQAVAPFEPKVTFLSHKRHSITFKVESSDTESDLPIKTIEISHLRESQVDAANLNDDEISDDYWRSQANTVKKAKSSDDIYEVTGLRHAHEYVFRFRQVSDAGFGESVVLRAKTFNENDLTLNSSFSIVSIFLMFVVAILML
ncbi:unnamed protein product [Caenorhabditis angaria]|uniref:Ig-like domain-containing protein n=1 Tax=Caenorhabditis angaria TaxID=860376 RepID=A0A9P1J4N8_9PELO|nr:unnamed protein product [Caenorhabditis angaria]